MEATRGSAYRYLSSGLPMPNGVEDLWSQTLWLSPRVLGYKSYAEFSRWHLRHTGDEFGMSDAWIMRHIGIDMDELLRLKQISGLAALFRDREFSTAQEAIE